MYYKFSHLKGNDRFIPIEFKAQGPFSNNKVELQLPAWRPGRYELGYFSKNIRSFKVTDSNGVALPVEKTSHSTWLITEVENSLHITYEYYANILNGGSCWWDYDQLFINPIQCALFIPGREMDICTVELDIPANWMVASSMKHVKTNTFLVDNFHELVDSPFIASPNIKHGEFEMDEIKFHVWLQGNCNPDMDRILDDISKYTRIQLDTMKSFPVQEFHYLTQIRADKYYHGVEHTKSTVLVLGPGKELMQDTLYKNFIGVASHELFHVWNVKSIRPVEMHPYNYSSENYSKLGFVYEGVTTYYGDLFLCRSGFFSIQEYLSQVNTRLQKHMNNPGRLNYSVLESSFDTWLDGYIQGIPGRKTSIYDEGCLLALATDLLIRKHSNSVNSLDDVMRTLYNDFAIKGLGYSLKDYINVVNQCATKDLNDFFSNVVSKAVSYNSFLNNLLEQAGMFIDQYASDNLLERYLGIKVLNKKGSFIVYTVYDGAPAMRSGILINDEIISVNEYADLSSINTKVNFRDELNVKVLSNHVQRSIQIKIDSDAIYYNKFEIKIFEDMNNIQLEFRDKWLK